MSKAILIVDDEPNVRLSRRMALGTVGYTVVEMVEGAFSPEPLTMGES